MELEAAGMTDDTEDRSLRDMVIQRMLELGIVEEVRSSLFMLGNFRKQLQMLLIQYPYDGETRQKYRRSTPLPSLLTERRRWK